MEKRRALVSEKGYTQGENIPQERTAPLNTFLKEDGIICEIKRKSPSRSNIDTGLDPVKTAGEYMERGIRNISVLTEPNYFGGSLTDLMKIKAAYPDASVLRKDFIIDIEDIDVAYRAGADAVLLIAAVHEPDSLAGLYRHAEDLGLGVLLEIHDRQDLEKAEKIKPALLGINTRDLKTFIIDPAIPLRLKPFINWECRMVFESGIHSYQQAAFAESSGASALLVGESVVKNKDLIADIREGFTSGLTGSFWEKLFTAKSKRPLVKICGITNKRDLEAADRLGADILGIIFAESPRKVSVKTASAFPDTKALKAGVLVLNENDSVPKEITGLLEKGKLDALQIHGSISDEKLKRFRFPVYRAYSLKDESVLKQAAGSFCPRVLLDAFASGLHGGTGKQMDSGIAEKAAAMMPLWLAGGLNPDNIASVIREYKPELVDAGSGLEESPGVKDIRLLEKYISEIRKITEHKNELA